VMPEADAAKYRYNPFDITKVWPHKDYPLIDVGTIELNRNAQNYFADVEQAAFTPANVVPGIGFSPDRLLQGRLFSYGDTQRYRLGVNHHQIPVNASQVPRPHSFHRDGGMRTDGNLGTHVNYEPNRFGEFAQDRNASEPPLAAGAVDRYEHREDEDYYSQPAALFRQFDAAQRERLFGNIARHIHGVPQEIVARQIEHFHRIDPAYAQGVNAALVAAGKGAK
jgi:catalase